MSEQESEAPKAISHEDEYARLSEVFESSARRWELIIYPSLFAFIVLALYGFYLIYNLQRDVHYLAISVDRNMTTLAGNMQVVAKNMGQLTTNVRAMTVSLDSIDHKVSTLEPMLANIHSMDQSMRDMTRTTGALNAAAQGMNLHMYRMNRDLGRPMRIMNAFMPW
ncbi:DUF948 domain-containing protein [endosymbiont of unidentified scaly snail isolate Monju]|uniref:DUF948 domain-containing protein n=1 Tax=endosymbiont of unidentified scaly snail isolate Monju TaxID=1248727 RepID=UPI0003891ED2|nr:DUF948 domain-containing protein [endosymbiont of unidentified scaly snail isolate Monju]BAN68811.1 conserved hypothetical protein [endosymbiont of unidentified scaly snail isolate Monju]